MRKSRHLFQKIGSGLFATAFLSVWLSGVLLFQPTGKAKNCNIEIVAHRGYSSRFPENTLAAFRGAADAGADYVELDVRQTKDGVLVVMHDSSLLRTAGLDRDVCDVTYDEIRDLKVGERDFIWSSGETIPTLEEVLQFLKSSGLKLDIELKPCGGDDYEKAVVDLILKERLQERCLIASCDCGILRQVKSCAPEITTVYVGSDFESCVLRLPYADAISLKADCVNASIVRLTHAAGKPLYVWTIDSKQEMDTMMALGVDGIITDNPVLAVRRTYFLNQQYAVSAFSSGIGGP